MSKYNLDLDYAISIIDISTEELYEIITEANKIILENGENLKELATAYLKKAQCLYEIVEFNEFNKFEMEDLIFQISQYNSFFSTITITTDYKQLQPRIKSLLEKALELCPDMPEALMLLGTTYGNLRSEEGHIDKALYLLTKAIQLKPDYAAAFNNRADIIKESNSKDDIKKAIADYSEAIQIRPFEAHYYWNRGLCYSDLDIHEKAVDDFTNSIKYGSDTFKKMFHIFYERGNEYMELLENDKAIDDFSESLRLEPDHIKSLFRRRLIYDLAGERVKAKADFVEYFSRISKLADDVGRTEISKHIGILPDGI